MVFPATVLPIWFFIGVQSRNDGFLTLVLTWEYCKYPELVCVIMMKWPRLFAGVRVEKVVSLNLRFITFFSDSCQEITVNLIRVINGGRDVAGMQVREAVGLNHGAGHPISREFGKCWQWPEHWYHDFFRGIQVRNGMIPCPYRNHVFSFSVF